MILGSKDWRYSASCSGGVPLRVGRDEEDLQPIGRGAQRLQAVVRSKRVVGQTSGNA